jgi:hypothetical protein
MYKGQQCIAILTDRSYLVRDIGIPMNQSFELIQNNFKDTYFVYGMNYMIDLEIEGYLNVFKVPDDHRIKFQYSADITSAIAISRQFLNILQYNPDKVILFRDNPQSTDTSVFVLTCVKNGISITAIDDFGNKTDLNAEIMNRRVYNTLTIGKGVRHP